MDQLLREDLADAYLTALELPVRLAPDGRVEHLADAVLLNMRVVFAAGARAAVLHPNRMSLPLFRSVGFRPVEEWTYLTA